MSALSPCFRGAESVNHNPALPDLSPEANNPGANRAISSNDCKVELSKGMNYATSRHIRRIVGRLAKGERVLTSLERLCRREKIRAGSVRAVGLLSNVRLQSYNPTNGYTPSLEAEQVTELLSLEGNISTLADTIVLNCYVHIGSEHMGQLHTCGGTLAEATAFSVEFVIEAYDDLVMERRLESRVGLPLLNKIETITGDSTISSTRDAAPAVAAPKPAPVVEAPKPVAPTPAPVVEAPKPAAPKPAPVVEAPKPAAPKPAAPKPAPAQPKATSFSSEGMTSKPAAAPQVVSRRLTSEKPAEAPKASWADAIQYSEDRKTQSKLGVSSAPSREYPPIDNDWDDEPDGPEIEKGDFLRHPHFGICKVLFVEEEDYVQVRTRSGKIIKIKLEVCELTLNGEKEGKNVFDCKIVRR